MAIKKSELYSSLWKSCDELRGSMDASEYKNYILVLLFVKYVSDKYGDDPNSIVVIPEGSSFSDMVKLKGTDTIGDDINKLIVRKLADANGLTGVITMADFNDEEKLGRGKEMVEKLTNLIAIFENPALNFSKNRADGDDLLGDAYEYLMRHFATQSGKSKGQFYTPAEVSRIIAKVIGIEKSGSQSQSIYDPTCGSGSLLLKAADEAPHGITIFGQENDGPTSILAKMNMVLHNQATAVGDILKGNTMANPLHKDKATGQLKTFDFAVSNPPFSSSNWTTGFDPENDRFHRFKEYGLPPQKNGDFAFLLHLVKSLKPGTGKGAIILPHGVLFRGNAEATVRENLLRKGYIKGIIGLPANLFYGTGIPACIIVIDKEGAVARRGIFMVDASKGYVKDGAKNRLREQDIHRIVDVFNKQTPVPSYARMVRFDEIEANEYNLNIPRYIDSQEPEDIQDIEAHLLGGIPERDVEALAQYWEVFPALRNALFQPSERSGYQTLLPAQADIKETIFSHPDFINYMLDVNQLFESWKTRHTAQLKALVPGFHPKALIHDLAEDILQTFSKSALLDPYDVYQHLMTYWLESMQDDAYIISADGWKAELSLVKDKRDEYECDLVPKYLVVNRYFAAEKKNIEWKEAQLEDLSQQIETFKEERSGEGDVLDAVGENGKIRKQDLERQLDNYRMEAIRSFDPKGFGEWDALHKAWTEAQNEFWDLERHSYGAKRYLEHLKKGGKTLSRTIVGARVAALRKEIVTGAQYSDAQQALVAELTNDLSILNDWEAGQDDPVFQELDFFREYQSLDKKANDSWRKASKKKTELLTWLEKERKSRKEEQIIKDLTDLEQLLDLMLREDELKKEIKTLRFELERLTLAKYPQLTEAEIKLLVVDDKWMTTIRKDLQAELDSISQRLTRRIKELAERYETTLEELTMREEALTKKVNAHLEKMGFVW